MGTPEEDSTATAPAAEAPQRSPQPSTVLGWSAQRSPQQSIAMSSPAPSDVGLPPAKLKSALETQDAAGALVQPVTAAGKLCHSPVTARSGKDMIGAHTELSTGITYPYNMWGPCNPTRFGHVGEVPATRDHRYNYQGKHETLMKDRLEERDFGHIRHHCYCKNLIEPTVQIRWHGCTPRGKSFGG